MNTSELIQHERNKKGLSKKELSQFLGISEMHIYDLEAYDNELETTLNIGQIYKLAGLLNIPPEKLCKELEQCHTSEENAFEKISQLISQAGVPLELLSENIGWELKSCAKSIESLKEQPIDFFKDFANWFKVPFESVMPNIKNI